MSENGHHDAMCLFKESAAKHSSFNVLKMFEEHDIIFVSKN